VSQYLASSRAVNAATARCYQHGAAGPWQIVIFIARSNRRSLLMAGYDDKMFMTRNFNVTSKTKEQHLIVCSDKSAAYVTNTRKLHSTFRTIDNELTTDRHESSRGLFARAFCHYRAIDCPERLVSAMTYYVSTGTLNPVDSFIQSAAMGRYCS